ncbi:MAG: hypothetical protein QOK67_09090 [Nitrososphaeraceae archaeon]|nr:hypothetical protein [Nitrososphaeraceae archaeon]
MFKILYFIPLITTNQKSTIFYSTFYCHNAPLSARAKILISGCYGRYPTFQHTFTTTPYDKRSPFYIMTLLLNLCKNLFYLVSH